MHLIKDHWLEKKPGIRHCLSPNHNERPSGTGIDLLVIHNISLPPGQFGGNEIEQFFTNSLPAEAHPYFQTIAHLQVSAHALIRRDGEIIQFVPFNARAWHAGDSLFEQRKNCNDFSIGIELEGTDESPFELCQYEALGKLVKALLESYPHLHTEKIVGHSDIAPGRKTDPGPYFDWPLFQSSIA